MIFKNARSVKDGVYTTSFEFVSYGTRDMDGEIDLEEKEKEEEIIRNFGVPQVPVGGLFYGNSDYYFPDSTNNGETGGVDIEFYLPEKYSTLNKSFKASYSVDVKELQRMPQMAIYMNIEARLSIFEEVIASRIDKAAKMLSVPSLNMEKEGLGEIIFHSKNTLRNNALSPEQGGDP